MFELSTQTPETCAARHLASCQIVDHEDYHQKLFAYSLWPLRQRLKCCRWPSPLQSPQVFPGIAPISKRLTFQLLFLPPRWSLAIGQAGGDINLWLCSDPLIGRWCSLMCLGWGQEKFFYRDDKSLSRSSLPKQVRMSKHLRMNWPRGTLHSTDVCSARC